LKEQRSIIKEQRKIIKDDVDYKKKFYPAIIGKNYLDYFNQMPNENKIEIINIVD